MGYHKQLTIKQREDRLIDLIKDAKELGFNKDLIQNFKNQLNQIQAEIKADKEKMKININVRGLN